MSTGKQILSRMINELPEDSVPDIIYYVSFVLKTKKNSVFNEMEQASISSLDFWNNEADDEVWNNV